MDSNRYKNSKSYNTVRRNRTNFLCYTLLGSKMGVNYE